LRPLKRTWREWKELRAFQRIPREQRQIVVYSEGGGYLTFLEPIINALWAEHGQAVLYVTSSPDDPYLSAPPGGVTAFQIGTGTVRTAFFSMLDVDLLAMTMPDLETFHIKRSLNGVHYAYIQHSIVSTHMVYREAAFDNFDTVFCAGPHHIAEIRKREALHNLPPKHLVKAGYCRLDFIMDALEDAGAATVSEKTVLVAPSWGPDGLIEKHGLEVVENLLDAGLNVILRPHPRTMALYGDLIHGIGVRFGGSKRFRLDTDPNAVKSLLSAQIMISDWSGAALEFGFGLLRPVLFVDVPRKLNNPAYNDLCIEPLEVSVRGKLGTVLPLTHLQDIGSKASQLIDEGALWYHDLRTVREELVYNVGKSGSAGAQALMEILCKRRLT
jgi:hypothetical protein